MKYKAKIEALGLEILMRDRGEYYWNVGRYDEIISRFSKLFSSEDIFIIDISDYVEIFEPSAAYRSAESTWFPVDGFYFIGIQTPPDLSDDDRTFVILAKNCPSNK